MTIKRHVGVITSTGTRCIVVFRELPDDVESCLIFEADSLPDFYREPIVGITMKEGQKVRDLFEVLSRFQLQNGVDMLTALHKYGFLRKMATSDITMIPDNSSKIRLDELNFQLRQLDEANKFSEKSIQDKLGVPEEDSTLENVGIAEKLLAEAAKLEADALSKRTRAYTLKPDLAPKVVDIDECDNSTSCVIDLTQSQRQAVAAVQTAWRQANPGKTK